MPNSTNKSKTLNQFHKDQISKLWASYRAQREQLDESIQKLQESPDRIESILPTCDTPGCTNSKQVRIGGRNTWVCQDSSGTWVACDR